LTIPSSGLTVIVDMHGFFTTTTTTTRIGGAVVVRP